MPAPSAHAAARCEIGAGTRLIPPDSSKLLPFASVFAEATWSPSALRLSWLDSVSCATPVALDGGAPLYSGPPSPRVAAGG